MCKKVLGVSVRRVFQLFCVSETILRLVIALFIGFPSRWCMWKRLQMFQSLKISVEDLAAKNLGSVHGKMLVMFVGHWPLRN